jgi:2,3,4,5-tetrahydropyridine-2,6-dicarboxylate N-succinyltransferase
MTAAWGLALVTRDDRENVLDAWFPDPHLGDPTPGYLPPDGFDQLTGDDPVRRVTRLLETVTVPNLDEPPTDSLDGWLRLHLLSHRLVQPQTINMDGIFGVLTNVVWTSIGPCAVDGFEATRLRAAANGTRLSVLGVDKFPRMTDYVVPTGIRIADADRVRLGAHLAAGTTVMHEGFVNYNAGTVGASMIEGRVSAGVLVGDGSDVGGGASIMGTLSGGGAQVISVGARCLIGANAGIGISLGDDCVVAAGCYVTAGTKVTLDDGSVVKASALSGESGLQFWTNSLTGAVEARPRRGAAVALNASLHTNQ